jgi:transposase
MEREDLKQKLQSKSYWTAKEARQLIQDEFGKSYHPVSVSRILHSLGMKYGKPYPRDYRRPDDAEAKLKLTLEASLRKLDDLEAQEPQEARQTQDVMVGFLDECSPQSCANTVRVYSFGKAINVKDTTKYRANTFGFYAPYGTSIVGIMENSKKESVCSFLEDIKRSNPKAKIVAILDNFPSHKANVTREKAEELGILLTFLPPHSPDLNPIEQLWRCLKREISSAFFRSEDEFLAIIQNAYSQLSRRLSFASNWFLKFLPQGFNQLCN